MDNRPIGILDSGVGGLTVASEIKKLMPQENIVYYGDTGRAPFGGKSRETLLQYGLEIIEFLLKKDVKLVVVACATLSSNVYQKLENSFDIHMVNVIEPGIRACADAKPKNLGVIATKMTIASGMFTRRLKELSPGTAVYERACPLFATMTEEGWANSEAARIMAGLYLDGWNEKTIDALVLGCTHYPLLIGHIKKILGNVNIINMAANTAHAARSLLKAHDMENGQKTPPAYDFYVSGDDGNFIEMAKMLLGIKCEAKKAVL